jgi:hypothetical protein
MTAAPEYPLFLRPGPESEPRTTGRLRNSLLMHFDTHTFVLAESMSSEVWQAASTVRLKAFIQSERPR